jgi:urea carboxylase
MLDFGLKHTHVNSRLKAKCHYYQEVHYWPIKPKHSLKQHELVIRHAEKYRGGGGIGMRLVWNETELKDAYQTVSYLAQANFKDAGLYLEKFVQHARHIEVQIFGDGQGQVLALGERDCSVQRQPKSD